eukprot:gene19936-biopygen5541
MVSVIFRKSGNRCKQEPPRRLQPSVPGESHVVTDETVTSGSPCPCHARALGSGLSSDGGLKRKNAFSIHMEENDGKQRKMTENSGKTCGSVQVPENGGKWRKMTEKLQSGESGGKWRKEEDTWRKNDGKTGARTTCPTGICLSQKAMEERTTAGGLGIKTLVAPGRRHGTASQRTPSPDHVTSWPGMGANMGEIEMEIEGIWVIEAKWRRKQRKGSIVAPQAPQSLQLKENTQLCDAQQQQQQQQQ